MHKSSDFKMPLIVFILSLFLIVLCYSYVDRPVVFFLHAHHARKFSFLKVFANDRASCNILKTSRFNSNSFVKNDM